MCYTIELIIDSIKLISLFIHTFYKLLMDTYLSICLPLVILLVLYEIGQKVWNIIRYLFVKELSINLKFSPKCSFAIIRELENNSFERKRYALSEGVTSPIYNLADGTYYIGNINIYINDEEIKLTSICESLENLKQFVNECYRKHCSSESPIAFFIPDKDEWSFPILRTQRNFDILSKKNSVKSVLNDLNKFKQDEKMYKNKGQPFRRGYLYHFCPK